MQERISFKDLKAKVSLLDLLRAEGFMIPPGRNKALLRCPFHEDKRSSLGVSHSRFYCYASTCGQKGSILDWLMMRRNLNISQAAEVVKEFAGGRIDMLPDIPKAKPIEQDLSKVPVDEKLVRLWRFYKSRLSEGLAYLASRGLRNLLMLKAAGVGFAPKLRRVVFPCVYNEQLLNLHTRAIDSGVEPKYRQFRAGRPVVPFVAGKMGNVIGVTEGQIDALSLAEAGLPTLATAGSNRAHTLDLLLRNNTRFKPERFIVIPDNDAKLRPDGRKPSDVYFETMRRTILELRPEARVDLFLPRQDLKDSNDWLCADRKEFFKAVAELL